MEPSVVEQQEGGRGGRKGARRLRIGLGVVVGALALWIAAHHTGQDAPPPLFTEADLPPPPPAGDNGWLLVASPSAALDPPRIPIELARNVLGPDRGGPLLEEARKNRDAIVAFAGTPDAQGALRALERAVAMPRFADRCTPLAENSCLVLPLLNARRIGALEALRRGVDGDWAGALSLAGRLSRADVDVATSSRTLSSHLIGVHSLELGLDVSVALLDGYLQARGQGAAPLDAASTEALRAVDAALAGLDPAALAAHRAVVGEYLATRSQIDLLLAREAPAWDPWSRLVLDRAATLELVNHRFSELSARVAAPSAPPPARAAPRDHALWWTYNPAGKVAIEHSYFDWEPHLQELEAQRAHIEVARTRVREAVRTILQGA